MCLLIVFRASSLRISCNPVREVQLHSLSRSRETFRARPCLAPCWQGLTLICIQHCLWTLLASASCFSFFILLTLDSFYFVIWKGCGFFLKALHPSPRALSSVCWRVLCSLEYRMPPWHFSCSGPSPPHLAALEAFPGNL